MVIRPNLDQREHPETDPIHAADTAITNDTLPYVMVSADPDTEIAQQYDPVVSRYHSKSGMLGVVKAIFHIIRRV